MSTLQYLKKLCCFTSVKDVAASIKASYSGTEFGVKTHMSPKLYKCLISSINSVSSSFQILVSN